MFPNALFVMAPRPVCDSFLQGAAQPRLQVTRLRLSVSGADFGDWLRAKNVLERCHRVPETIVGQL